jgi:hypothetical protein
VILQYVNDTFLTIKGQCDFVSILYDFKKDFGLEINVNKHNILARILEKRLKVATNYMDKMDFHYDIF